MVLSKGRTGSDVHVEMTTLVAERRSGQRGGGERNWGMVSGVQERGTMVWPGWLLPGAEMDEKGAQCQGLVTDWAGVRTGRAQSKSQGFNLSS